MIKNIVLFTLFLLLGIVIFLAARWTFVTFQTGSIISPKAQSKFSLATAPSESLTAQVTSLSGSVEWQSRIADTPSPLSGLIKLQQGESITTIDDGDVSITLSGIVSMELFPLTTINLIQTLPANIVIQQSEGQAEYNVLNSAIPFSVRGLDLLVHVMGDALIAVDKKTTTVTVSIKSGKAILAYNDTNNVSQLVDVKSGQKAVFINNTKTMAVR